MNKVPLTVRGAEQLKAELQRLKSIERPSVIEAIAERIQPVGSVHLAGAQAVVAEPTGPLSGDQVYAKFCTACHATGALNAPKFGDKAAWGPRVAQGKETLYHHAIAGFNQMPAKGTCMACSDDEIKAAVDHMLGAL